MKKEHVVFFFPWKEISGGPVYLSGLANTLAQQSEYAVGYVDYPKGVTDAMLCQEVERISYFEPFLFPHSDPLTLVIPIYCASHIPTLHPDSKILFVNWHNYSIQALLDSWRLSPENLREFLLLVRKTDSVFFLDKTHWLAQNEWIQSENCSFKERYVPTMIAPKSVRSIGKMVRDKELHIGVLGRLCKDKIFSLLNLICQLNDLKTDYEIHLHVIGEGSEAYQLQRIELRKDLYLHREGTITGTDLSEFLAKRTDILFAMGLSVLEGAAIALPSVVMPHNVKEFHLDAYAFLQDCQGYALGWYDTQLKELKIPIHPLEEILHALYAPGGKQQIGMQAFEYLKKNHFDNRISMMEALSATTLSAKDFSHFQKRQGKIYFCKIPIARLESSFDESEKRISFLGIQNFCESKKISNGHFFYLLGKQQKIFRAKKEDGHFRLYIGSKRVPFIKL